MSQEERARLLFDTVRQYDVHWPRPPEQRLSWYFAQQDEIRARTHALVREIGDPDHVARSYRREFTLRWVLHHLTCHESYHGGQAVLLSLMRTRYP